MYVLTPESMGKCDQETIEAGIPEILLMEAAARETAEFADRIIKEKLLNNVNYYQKSEKKKIKNFKITILVGKGNNGGDGLAAARILTSKGYQVEIILAAAGDELSGVNKKNYELCLYHNLEYYQYDELNSRRLLSKLKHSNFIIDALLGTGITGEVRGNIKEIIPLINQVVKEYGKKVLAVDIPSGINGKDGSVAGRAVKADYTVTMAAYKRGLLLYPGSDYAGRVEVVDIGIKEDVIAKNSKDLKLFTQSDAQILLPLRKNDGHKGTFGKIAFLAGSRGMGGAPLLSTEAALRSGSGLVYLLTAAEVEAVVANQLKELLSIPLASSDGIIAEKSLEKILDFSSKVDLLAAGPGLGNNEATQKVIRGILENLSLPLVLDADALNSIKNLDLLKKYGGEILITPHPGEMARLLDKSITEINQNRIEIARDFAKKYKVNVILKGAATVTAAADGRVYLNHTGTNGMATAGSGDVLTGIVSALIGQGMPMFDAAALAVYVHGRSGELAAEQKSDFGLKSGDIIDFLPEVWKLLKIKY
ncbi:NAD(P)H-hydrate epimerase [Halanaerobium saccharolyticum]|uniref:Bifunctional NAD(P)H-hydrate repair enzyme n=1 Tax=Halanaerobium saccharolyticum TaxID=43595 RepID=A0A4R7Z6D8_9FIRM|nr:NAD(P)H-hydrate dehydratase [Halanaerobium saccharolyticum]RAK07766.1 NAD(P)H-hydrate epimerase [Halanaerobium saccharolyticum]TDW03625.1 NAD(P)H-hydrate epimerase [Halanaerobium saccharolyticum]TDX59464.1 NAD(P)H-hydrate epimerase [Halanaerobium saccharolyticum]